MIRNARVPLLSLVAASVTVGCFQCSPASAQATVTAVVRQVAHRAPAGTWQASKVGTQLATGAGVRTGKRSNAEVKLGANVVRLSERSSITLSGNTVTLDQGKIYGAFKSDTIIKGGKCVATIKGTTALFSLATVEDAVMFVIDVLSGGPVTLAIPGLGQPLVVGAGQRGTAPAGGVGPGTPQGSVSDSPNTEEFKNADEGTASSFADDIVTGTTTVVTPGARDATRLLETRLDERDTAQEGGDSHQRAAAAVESYPCDSSHYMYSVGRAFLSPRVQGQAFVYKRDGTRSLAGARVVGSAVYDKAFLQFAVQPQTLFQGNVNTDVTDFNVVFRNAESYGEIVVGRQRFLKGPVELLTSGTLLSQEIMDAITWRPPLTNPKLDLDLSLIHDAFPLNVGGNQDGYYARVGYQWKSAQLGGSAMKVSGIANLQTAGSLDFSAPVLPGKVDLYGEFGSNALGQNMRTFGAYFPGLYDRYGVDTYLETTKGVGFTPGFTALRMYKELNPTFTALFTMDRAYSNNDINLGIGVVAKILK